MLVVPTTATWSNSRPLSRTSTVDVVVDLNDDVGDDAGAAVVLVVAVVVFRIELCPRWMQF